jgi:hypothetical protein
LWFKTRAGLSQRGTAVIQNRLIDSLVIHMADGAIRIRRSSMVMRDVAQRHPHDQQQKQNHGNGEASNWLAIKHFAKAG